jgi:hypothetical protein
MENLLKMLNDQQEQLYELEIEINDLRRQNIELLKENEELRKENEINVSWFNYYASKYHGNY